MYIINIRLAREDEGLLPMAIGSGTQNQNPPEAACPPPPSLSLSHYQMLVTQIIVKLVPQAQEEAGSTCFSLPAASYF